MNLQIRSNFNIFNEFILPALKQRKHMEVLHDKQFQPDEQTETGGIKDVHPSTPSQTINARADNSPSFTSTTSSTNMLISQRQQHQQQDKEQVDNKEQDEQEDEQEPELEQANKNENETYDDNQLRGFYKKSNKSKMSGNKIFGSRKNMDSFSINSTPTKNNISEPPRTQSLSMLLTINKPPPRNGKKGDSKHSGLARLLSIIYAILIIICGFIFPFVEILQDQWLETWYNGIHIFYIYTLGTLIFIYMQVVLALPSSDCSRKNHSRTASSSGEMSGQIRNHYVNHGFATTNSAKLHEQNSIKKPNTELNVDVDLDNKLASQYNISNQEQNTRKQKIGHSTSFNAKKNHANKKLITAVLKFNSTTRLNSSSNINRSSTTNLPTDEKDEDEMSETIQRHNSMLEEIPTVDEETCEEEKMEEVFIDLSELGSIFSHNGSSFFLRIGTLRECQVNVNVCWNMFCFFEFYVLDIECLIKLI
ncbi:hypothetical protein HELRODRAFT_168920 [Helobdella robusta]|uniref:Uncharacterized protein n=1 Tax=Helobdella robusta TaxID=6412 RepID=T1F147_HELRO|nr:hypothetical protein HELRODRAFT_168920 [Helobdella robusta]ESO08990.1 hypothetical protein HELRODRAFT_168920 [Helobdella robusta]